MQTLPTLTLSMFKMFVRDRQALFFTLIIPIILMGIFGLIGFDKVSKIKVGVAAAQPTPPTQAFIDALRNVEALDVHLAGEPEERSALEKGDRAVVLLLPDDVMPDPAATAPLATKTVTLLTNVAQPQQTGAAVSIITKFLDETTLRLADARRIFDVRVEEVNAKKQKYVDFLLPGIIAMSIMQMAVFSVSFVFVYFKEKGILKRLLATPMRPYQFVLANVITRLIIALAQAAILLALGILIFRTQVLGAWWLMLLIAVLGGVMFLGLGFIISGIAKTEESVPALANIIVFPMLFLSGVFFPVDTMPDWLQRIVQYLPLSYFAHALREVMANGATLFAVRADLLWMLGWSAVLVTLAMITFRFEERRV